MAVLKMQESLALPFPPVEGDGWEGFSEPNSAATALLWLAQSVQMRRNLQMPAGK
jgi:hypothetical protein